MMVFEKYYIYHVHILLSLVIILLILILGKQPVSLRRITEHPTT